MEALSKQKKVTLASKATSKYKTPFFGKQSLQKKLEIGSSKDAYEVEADAMANKVVNMSDSQVEQTSQTGMLVQRKCASCEQEEKLQKKSLASEITPIIQRQSNGEKAGTASQTLSQQINSTKGGGQSMDNSTKHFMESQFGADFLDVRLHTNSQAIQMNREINAQAFTVGNDIYFNQGKYNPGTSSGKHLLAHELTHTLQQNGIQRKRIQREFAIDPVAQVQEDIETLNEREVSEALHYNLNRFQDAAELNTIRDVLGLSQLPERQIDQDFVIAVAEFQLRQGLTEDGKLGPDTLSELIREYRAEAVWDPSMNTDANRLSIRTNADERAYDIDVNSRNNVFDAILSHRNARLVLYMRINFNFHSGPVGSMPTAAEQTAFINEFRRDVEGIWSEQYALIPKNSVPSNYLNWYSASVLIEDTNSNPHYTVHAGNTTSAYQTTNPPGSIGSGGPAVMNASNSLRIGIEDTGNDTLTTRQYADGSTRNFRQYTSSHEFGHMLGLDHIACSQNNMNCYGGNANERGNIMGLGNNVSKANYLPFQVAMKEITGVDWNVE